MSLTEVLPEVQSLTRSGKIRLIQLLAHELERDEGGVIEPGPGSFTLAPFTGLFAQR